MNEQRAGRVAAICISDKKGVQKQPVTAATLEVDFGLVGDAHAGPGHRQVSLLADESADRLRQKGATISHGDFGENITTTGIDLSGVAVGDTIRIGDVALAVTQIGKTCHTRCAIFEAAGTCVMPTNGIFCRVMSGGSIATGEKISVD